jgi:hypothetical protein
MTNDYSLRQVNRVVIFPRIRFVAVPGSRRSYRGLKLVSLLLLTSVINESSASADPPADSNKVKRVELNQGWSKDEIAFYYHASEGTFLAPLEFALQLPNPKEPDAKFLDTLARYGFIEDKEGPINSHRLPVGLAEDSRPKAFGDRSYLGMTCAACHTRELTFRKPNGDSDQTEYRLPVYAGPSLIDLPSFLNDFYGAFEAILEDDALAKVFAKGVLGHDPEDRELDALRKEVKELITPVLLWRKMVEEAKVPVAKFGPGNLNALTQGNLNGAGLVKWMLQKGVELPPTPPPTVPRFEGTVNFPPLWYAFNDDWAQWFVKIHHSGTRNWIQAVASSAIRPPKMVEGLGAKAIIATVNFDNIERIQSSLERLRTPKWPEQVFGELDAKRIAKGRVLYERSCAECHDRQPLAPNELGIILNQRRAYDVGTDPTAYQQFAEDGERRAAGLAALSEKILLARRAQLLERVDEAEADNYAKLDSRGRPNRWGLAVDEYASRPEMRDWPTSGAPCWAPPLDGVFASSPYFHNGSVRTLWEVLLAPEERAAKFHTGTTEFDAHDVGLRDEGDFEFDTGELGKSNRGHAFGVTWSKEEKLDVLEYLKSI